MSPYWPCWRSTCAGPRLFSARRTSIRLTSSIILTNEPTGETRNVLRESARIARGKIIDVAHVAAADLDALIIPGGFGAAKNLCNFAERGADCDVNPDVERLVAEMLAAKKPIGAICIAPAMLARVCGKHDVAATVTIGTDAGTAAAIGQTGCMHQDCAVTDIAIDHTHKIVTTPAYMLGHGPAEVFEGIRKLVNEVLALA